MTSGQALKLSRYFLWGAVEGQGSGLVQADGMQEDSFKGQDLTCSFL
jgi:hypothetical protein